MAKDLKLVASLKNNVSKEIDKIISDLDRLSKAGAVGGASRASESSNTTKKIIDNEEKLIRTRIALQRQSAALADRQQREQSNRMARANANSLQESRDFAEATLKMERKAAIAEAMIVENRFDRRIAVERVRHLQILADVRGNNAAIEAETRRHNATLARLQMDKAGFSRTPFQQLLGHLGRQGGNVGRVMGGMGVAPGLASGLGGGMGMMGAGMIGGPAGIIGSVVGSSMAPIVEVANKINALEKSLRFATGSSQAAGKEIAFLREETYRLGTSLTDVAPQYAKLAAAARGTAIEGAVTRDIFRGVSEASAALSLSGDETAGVFNALQQMISKGSIQAEELRGQVGERLPGAFQAAAAAVGLNTAELSKQLSLGLMPMEKFLPKFAEQLHKTYGDAAVQAAGEARAEISRFHNTVAQGSSVVGEAAVKGYGAVARYLNQVFSNGWQAYDATAKLNAEIEKSVRGNSDIQSAKSEELRKRGELTGPQKEALDQMIADEKDAKEQVIALDKSIARARIDLKTDETEKALALAALERKEKITAAKGDDSVIQRINQEHKLKIAKIDMDAEDARFEAAAARNAEEREMKFNAFRERVETAHKMERFEVQEEEALTKKHEEEAKKRKAIDDEEKRNRLAAAQGLFGSLAQLMSAFGQRNRGAARAAQKLAIAEAIMNTAVGVTQAYKQGGPLGLLTGLGVAAAGAAQIATISQQRFARGTDFAPGGMALVGEFGPETVYLPKGSRVDTAEKTSRSAGGLTHNGNVTINVSVPASTSQSDARKIGSALSDGYLARIKEHRRLTEEADYYLGVRR